MPPASPAIPPKRLLPSKEASLFREVLNLYESKQLKKGLKAADQILKKFPEHGETVCMKGLILTHMGKREEGLELVKKGVRLDLTSHICWHVFGLIQKGEKNYEEALKSYTQALRFDKENLNILRDAAHLQTQLRIYDGLLDTRHTILKLRPSLRQNWLALAVAYHLNGNLTEAKKVLDQYEYILKNVTDYDVEHSEVMLYHVRVLEDLGEHAAALSLLDTNAKSRAIVDRTAIMEFRARLLSKLGSTDEAEHAWRALIERNGDNYDYFRGFLRNKEIDLDCITNDNRSEALDVLRDFSAQIPRAAAPRRLALTVATGGDFTELVKTYLVSAITKGIPSLFADIKALYRDPEKQQVVEDIVEELRESLASSQPTNPDEPPTTYLWTLYFLAQHHSFLSRPARALSLLDLAFQHTPTLPELHTCKARVLKHAGDLYGAAQCLETARLLDGQDRFLNTKCAKYRLRAGLIDEANEILGLFTKKDAVSPGADLEDMQSLLYLIEEGDAHNRNHHFGLALKKYTAVQKIFDEIDDDQYDFHGYSLRKFTVNIYFNLIAWENKLRSHPAYVSAALASSRIWVAVHDDPSLAAPSTSSSNLDEKKAKKKARKAAIKMQESTKKIPPTSNEDKALEPPPVKDEDPDGSKLLASPDALELAAKFLSPVVALVKDNLDVWIATYDVAIRRKKYLQAVQALDHARRLSPEHPELHIRTIDLRQRVSSLPQVPPASIGQVLTEFISSILPDETSLETFNSQYLQRHTSSAAAVLAAAKVLRKLDAAKEEVEAVLFTTLQTDVQLDIRTALAIISFLGDIQSPRQDEYRAACDSKFESSTIFKPSNELEVLRKEATKGNTGEEADKVEVVG